jgi:hypothetical protein
MQGIGSLFTPVRLKSNLSSSSSNPTDVSDDNLSDDQLIDMPAPRTINHIQWKLSNAKERRQLLKESKDSNESKQVNINRLSTNAYPKEKAEAIKELLQQEPSEQQQQAILDILESVENRDDMKYILEKSGGAGYVLSHLGDKVDSLIEHLNNLGPEGQQMIIDMAINFYGNDRNIISNQASEFISKYISNEVLSQATLDEKVELLNQFKTSGEFPQVSIDAMSRIGGSIDSPQDMAYLINNMDEGVLSHANVEQKTYVLNLLMSQRTPCPSQTSIDRAILKLLDDPKMAVEIFKNLGDRGVELIQALKAIGSAGCKVIVEMATANTVITEELDNGDINTKIVGELSLEGGVGWLHRYSRV